MKRAGPPAQRQSGRSSGVEHNLAKVGVEGSNPFARSILAAQSILGIGENEEEASPADWRASSARGGDRLGYVNSDIKADPAGARKLAADVEWAARRLPFGTKCLPRAMALSWMLRGKSLPNTVVIAVRPNQLRQSPDALHAWVEVEGETILGELPGPWIETLRIGA